MNWYQKKWKKERRADFTTSLHKAAFQNHIAKTKFLLEEGSSPNVVNKYQHTPAHLAAFQGNLNVLQILVKHPEFDSGKTDGQKMTYLDWLATPLYKAVQNKDVLEMIQLLDLGADPHYKAKNLKKGWPVYSQKKKSAYELASQLGNETLLLFKNVNLIYKAGKGYINILREFSLQELESMRDARTSLTLLHVAADRDDVQLAKLLLGKGMSPNVSDNIQQTPAHLAALQGNLNILEIFVNHCEFDFKKEDKACMTYLNWLATPLYKAVMKNEVSKVEHLLSFGADPDCFATRLCKKQPIFKKNKKTARDLAFALQNNTLPLIEKIPIKNGPLTYVMNRNTPGNVCIFNYENFKHEKLKQRKGTEKDVKRILELFTGMGYTCETHSDYTTKNTIKTLKKIKNNIVVNTSCLIFFILSHGCDRNTFYTYDGKLSTLKLQEFFTNKRCLKLKNKPKLFFYQFCRNPSQSRETMNNTKQRKEAFKDMWCLYATNEGFKSKRSQESGAPFIRAVCKAIEENGGRKDLACIYYDFLKYYEIFSMDSSVAEMQNFKFKKFFFLPKCEDMNNNDF